MISRFNDGDSSNNVHCWDDGQAGNPDTDPAWHGDFKGLIEKLDYINSDCPHEYTVTFAGYATENLQSVTVEANTVITLPCRWYDLANFDRLAFMGYNTEPDGSGETYMDCTEYTVTGDVTLYAQWADIAIGDSFLRSGEYVDNDGNVTTDQPKGGYAHFEDGTLTLNNFTYTGEGYLFNHNPDYNSTATAAVYYGMDDLNLVLEGVNTLINPTEGGYGLRGEMNVTVSGTGSLTASAGCIAVFSGIDLTVESDPLHLTATATRPGYAIFSCNSFVLNGGNVTAESAEIAVYAQGDYGQADITVNGGTLNITSDRYGLVCHSSLTVTGGTVTVNAGEEFDAVLAYGGITIENVKILTPTNGTVQSNEYSGITQYYIADSEGNPASVVVISEEHAHIEETVPGKAPTCTEPGLTDGAKCSVCGETITAQIELPATDEHIFENGVCKYGCGTVDADYVPPVKVDGLVSTDTTKESFTLSWDALPGKVTYWVYVDGRIYTSTTGTTVTVAGRKAGTTYSVCVIAKLPTGTIFALEDADVISVITDDYSMSASSNANAYSVSIDWGG